jgi:hypothetical protein
MTAHRALTLKRFSFWRRLRSNNGNSAKPNLASAENH